MVTEIGIRRILAKEWENTPIHIFESVESTNVLAKQACLDHAEHGSVFLADRQTAGKGRMGRSFFSPSGCGIYFSIVLKLGLSMEDALYLTTAACVAVREGIYLGTGIETGIKWVNDLYYNQKKVVGILAEAVFDTEHSNLSGIVLGVGINYREPKEGFPKELQEAGALFSYDAVDGREALIATVLEQIKDFCFGTKNSLYLSKYRKYSLLLGREINVVRGKEQKKAVALAITDTGGLCVRYQDGEEETLISGEVSIRSWNV